jgi:hypothetical protein
MLRLGLVLIIVVTPVILASAADNECAEVISCGTKDGKVKEYRTPCDAEKDGATDVHARQGSSCTAEK